MNRIERTFKRLKEEKKKAFIPYITMGDPDIETTEKIVYGLVDSGADIIELGIPFSDPLADGPTIQRAVQRSLDSGFKIKKGLALVKKIRQEREIPLVFMTYYNIIFSYGVKKFIEDSYASGVDGVIVPDLPVEEAEDLINAASQKNICVIMLTAPTTSRMRFKKIAAVSKGFIYYVSLTGVTGERKKMAANLKSEVLSRKKLTKKPVCIGFGVSNSEQAKEIAFFADGVIVGSAIIKIIEENLGNRKKLLNEVKNIARSIASAVHSY